MENEDEEIERMPIWVSSRSEAARHLGLTRKRLLQIENNQRPAWWKDEFHGPNGFDIVGIAMARHASMERAKGQSSSSPKVTGFVKEKDPLGDDIKKLEIRKRLRVEATEEGKLIDARVVKSYHHEMWHEILRTLKDLAFAASRSVPDRLEVQCQKCGELAGTVNVKLYVFVDETVWEGKDLADASPVQRAIVGATEEIRSWLDMMSVDIFEQEDDFEARTDS